MADTDAVRQSADRPAVLNTAVKLFSNTDVLFFLRITNQQIFVKKRDAKRVSPFSISNTVPSAVRKSSLSYTDRIID